MASLRSACQAVPDGMRGHIAAVEASRSSEEPQVFARADPPFEITSVNQAWVALCGYTETEAVGQSCKILQGPDTSQEAKRLLHLALRDRTSVTVRLLNYTKFGIPFINDVTICTKSSTCGFLVCNAMVCDTIVQR